MIGGILSIFSTGVTFFIISRGTFGLGLGFMFPLTSTVVAETHPIKYRGKFIGLTKLAFVFGEMLSIVFAYFCLDSLETGNWRLLLACMSVTCFIG